MPFRITLYEKDKDSTAEEVEDLWEVEERWSDILADLETRAISSVTISRIKG